MATAEVELKSPFVPLFQRGIFSVQFSPLFAKEGKGRFSNRMTLELYSELLGQTLESQSPIAGIGFSL
jgi:hypothetical protein